QPVNSFPPGFTESTFYSRVISYNQVFRTGNPALESVRSMKKLALPLLVLAFAALAFGGDQDNQAAMRVKAASTVLEEIQTAPDTGIPDEVMGSAQCVAVVPSMLKAGFVFGARYGRGVASCRTAKGWSDPAFFTVQGGSFGLQIGGQAVDLIMLIMNQRGMENLLNSKFK